MATTTTNFGWDIPQSTDLVKDGATAIAALGQDIDTSMVDLKGGTTGQILSKTSNTDMDFTWINNDQGDITGVTAGTGLTGGGTSGAVTLDFDVANYGGGQWAAGKNKVINGNFAINQRNFTSNTASDSFNFDRFVQLNAGSTGTLTVTPQTFTLGTAPVTGYEAKNFVQCVTAAGANANTYAIYYTPIESVRTFAGQTATLSFWAKAGSGTPKIAFELAQVFGTGGSPSANVNTYAGQVTLSTSWARYSVTVSVPSIAGKTLGTNNNDFIALNLWLSAGSDFNSRTGSLGLQNNTFQLWGIQFEAGSTATPFQTATGNPASELAACQRYYWRNSASGVYGSYGAGYGASTTVTEYIIATPVTMRVAPTSVDYANLGASIYGSGPVAATSVTLSSTETTQNSAVVLGNHASGITQYRPYFLANNNSASGYIGFSAEL